MKASGAMSPTSQLRHLARLTFVAFLLTFIASRTLVILIMSRKLPDLFLHMGGTHVHHLNYGIFLLATVAGVLLFAPLNQAQRSLCALVYGAVIVVLSVLGLLAFAPRWKRLRAHHFAAGGVVLLVVTGFSVLLIKSLGHAAEKLAPKR